MRRARAPLACAGNRVAPSKGLATRALTDGVRGAIMLPGDDGPGARPSGAGEAGEGTLRDALSDELAHPPLFGAEPHEHGAIAAAVHLSLRSAVGQEKVSGRREPPRFRAGGRRFTADADGGLRDPLPPPMIPPAPQYGARAGRPPLGAAVHGEVEGRLIREVDLSRVTRFGAEFTTLLDRLRCDQRGPLVFALPAGDDLPFDVSLPRMTDPGGRPPVLPGDYGQFS